jgi:hypothetical protein
MAEQGTHKPLVPSSNLGVATESDDTPFEGVAMIANTQARIVTPVTWLAAPEWLTVDEACHLSGRDRGTLLFWVSDGDVDTNVDGLIAKDSLHEMLEALVLLAHWDD